MLRIHAMRSASPRIRIRWNSGCAKWKKTQEPQGIFLYLQLFSCCTPQPPTLSKAFIWVDWETLGDILQHAKHVESKFVKK